MLNAKIADYQSVNVRELWVVRSRDQTVEVIRLSVGEIESIGLYESGQTVVSDTFEGLEVTVSDVFAS